MIGVIDYGMGNLHSVRKALSYLGYEHRIIDGPESPEALSAVTHIILPGVGSYRAAVANLGTRGLDQVIHTAVGHGRPLLGICLGMQLLSTRGHEHGTTNGLNLIPGKVVQLDVPDGLRLPHVGWNTVELQREHPVFEGVRSHIDFYFVHSYHFVTDAQQDILGITDYGIPFSSCVARGAVVGLQFHPEKSQDSGLRLLENFCRWNGRC